MDAFTENILARARERQKMLEGYTGSDKTPLREANKDVKSSSQPNLTDVNKIKRKEVVSDSAVGTKSQNINSSAKENNSDSNLYRLPRQNSKTRISSEISGSPNSQSKTLNIQNDNFNMEIKLTSAENIRVEVAIEEQDDSDASSQMSEGGLRDESKNKLKRLGKLYAGGDDAQISSPIHRTEAKFYASENIDVEKNRELPESGSKCRKGLSKLATLAQTINQWEDDVNLNRSEKKTPPKRTWKPPAPQPPVTSPPKPSSVKQLVKGRAPEPPVLKKYGQNGGQSVAEIKETVQFSRAKVESPRKIVQESPKKTAEGTPGTGATPKQLKWDKNVLDTLESQGFTRTTSSSRLVYSYNSQDKKSSEVKTAQTTVITKAQIEHKPNTIIEEEEPVANDETDDCACPKTPTKTKSKTAIGQKMPKSPSKSNLAANIADKAAIFETSVNKNTKDPALLSVSERKALFEKNRGTALVPKAPIGLSAPVKVETTMKASSTKIITDENLKPSFVPKQIVETTKSPVKIGKYAAPKLPVIENTLAVKPSAVENTSPARSAAQKSGGIASRIALLQENKSTISQEQIEHNVRNQRDKELGMLLNRFNKRKDVGREQDEESEDEDVDATEETAMITRNSVEIVGGSAGNKPGEKRKSGEKRYGQGDSPVVTAVLDDVKRIRVSPPKAGKLYPNLSDIEGATETETDNQTRTPSPDNDSSLDNSDDPNTSFGRDILQAVCKNQTPLKRPIYDESTASDLSSILDDAEYLDELSNEENSSVGPTPPKQVRQVTQEKVSVQPSDSFNYKCFSPSAKSGSKFQSPVKIITSPKRQADLPTHVVVGDDVLPLTHTVSFYRKQQNQVQTPVRQITRQPLIEESSEEVTQEDNLVQQKITELQEEVNMQQNIVSQTSQALNLCSSTLEFSGSTEQVEAERVLLVATHRRQAAVHELQRLRVEGTIRPQGQHSQNVPLEKGTLTITNIVLPLKQKYVKALAAAGGKGHHVVCLIKCGEQVVPTKLVSTVVSNVKNPETELSIPGTVTLNNIYSDFTVTFEVYCLQAQEEFLPHEIKYHINKKSGTKLTTPKKSKQESRMVMPLKESPAGAQAVRTSSFALMGYVVFSVQAVNKRVWSLNNTPPMSPLEGSVEMRIFCELAVSVEHRGFLTMFEDVSGFGAWHRRWCLLKGHTLCYWKYPDDEKKMAPIDTIDLKNCITKQVGSVNREICARLHTFLIERERTARPQDKDTLVMIRKGEKTIIRHLLSADTKEERIEWCSKFNAALTALRMWGNTQQ